MPLEKNQPLTLLFPSRKADGSANSTTAPTITISKDGAAGVALAAPTLVEGMAMTWALSLTAAQMNCTVLGIEHGGAGLELWGTTIYPEAAYTAARGANLVHLDADVSSRGTSNYAGGAVASVTDPVTVGTNNDKTGYALSDAARVAVANEVEAQIIDDTDSEKVLQAIIDKIASANPSLHDLTLGAIASAVKTSVEAAGGSLAAIKAKTDPLPADPASNTQVQTRLAASDYTAPDNAGISTAAASAAAAETSADDAAAKATAIKAQTDKIPAQPAAVGSTMNVTTEGQAAIAAELERAGGLLALVNTGLGGLTSMTEFQVANGIRRFKASALSLAPAGEGGSSSEEVIQLLLRILGLIGENLVSRDFQYDPAGQILSFTIRTYDTAANAETDDGQTGLISQYSVTNTLNEDGLVESTTTTLDA